MHLFKRQSSGVRRPSRRAAAACRKRWLLRALGAAAVLSMIAIRWGPCPDVRRAPLPASFAVTDASGGMLRQVLAADGSDCRPVALVDRESWIARAVVAAEDKRFWRHPGIDPLALLRALGQNLRGRRVVSGASTLSTLVIRLTHAPCRRSVPVKAREYFQALQIDARLAKEEILTQYLNRAPFGGNVVGIQAASRRYFDKDWNELSLAEAALLAGLPQSPSYLRPDRHPRRAVKRRAYVLGRMLKLNLISPSEYESACAAPVVCRRQAAPFKAPHAVASAITEAMARPPTLDGGRLATTIDPALQAAAEAALRERVDEIGRAHASAGAVMVLRVSDGAVLALVGSPDYDSGIHAGKVNGALARRSPGSALKPFLYAAAFDSGALTAGTVVEDRAAVFGARAPANFDGRFRGEVTAGEALALSLNIPAYRIAQELGAGRFLAVLRESGLATLDAGAGHYGLALALGGCEVRLWDLVGAYGVFATGGRPVVPHLLPRCGGGPPSRQVFSAEACWLVNEALSGTSGTAAAAGPRIAWKTGTSSGMRDAWCVAWNPGFVVGVWLGNADGRGDEALVGAGAAAPLAMRVFRQAAAGVGPDHWFQRPDGLVSMDVCARSGREAAEGCAARVGDWRIAGVTLRRGCDRCGTEMRTGLTAASDRPVIVQPLRDTVLRRNEWMGEETVVPLQSAAGPGGRVFWFVNGEPAGEASRGETLVWRPRGVTGRVVVTCAAASAASDQVMFRIE